MINRKLLDLPPEVGGRLIADMRDNFEELACRDHLWRSDPRHPTLGKLRGATRWQANEVLFDTSAFRRDISGRTSKDEAKQRALAFAQCASDRIEIDADEGPPPWAE